MDQITKWEKSTPDRGVGMCKGLMAGAWLVQEAVRRHMSERDREYRAARGYVFSPYTKTLSKMNTSQGFFGEWMEVTMIEDISIPLAAQRGSRKASFFNSTGRRQELSGI